MKKLPVSTRISAKALDEDRANAFRLEAGSGELDAIAERFAFVRVEALRAELSVARIAGGIWQVSGRVSGEIVQSCVITGSQVPENVDFEVNERYVHSKGDGGEVFVGLEEIEPMVDGEIDLGEMVVQWLALNANDWPRAKDAPDLFQETQGESPHPFATLASLKTDSQ